MKAEEWWKNFALGVEVEVAGAFVYDGIKLLHELPTLSNSVDCFEVLYNLSVGIERLLKVAIILVEHDDRADVETLEKSLISHSTIDLANRLGSNRALHLADVHREFLALLSKFYKSHRYGRFSLDTVPRIDREKQELVQFLSKHLKIAAQEHDGLLPFQNTDRIRRFLGKVVKRVCDESFRVVNERAQELNIYTSELRSDSKASKVFYGKRLDFIDEDLKKRELLLFLMSEKSKGPHKDLLMTLEALDLDAAMLPDYIRSLLYDDYLPYVGGYVDDLYGGVPNVTERLDLLGTMDYEQFLFGEEDELDDPDQRDN